MIEMLKRFFQIVSALLSALESAAKSFSNIAAAAEKASEDLLSEQRLRREERVAELNRQIAAAEQLSPLPSTRVDRSHSNLQTGPQTDQRPERKRQLEAARPVDEAEVRLLGEQHFGETTGASPSRSLAEATPGAQNIEYVERLETPPNEHNRCSRSFVQRRDDRAPSRGSEARGIQELVAQLGIEYLVHFTREANLPSILQRGLVTRDVLRAEGQEDNCNDRYRLDGTDAVCASIGFPNYKMFFALRQEDKDVDWMLLTIDPSVLWETTVAFCAANAASRAVTEIPLRQRMGQAAMEAMFSDFGDKARATLNLPASFPTNPQAEVLLLDGVPRQYISGGIALNEAQKTRIEADPAGLKVVRNADGYRWRSDYEHWR